MSALTKTQAIQDVLGLATGRPVIFTTGYSARIGVSLGDRPLDFYMTGSMGLALSVGIGVAYATRRTTIVIDGDGSLLMNPVGLTSLGLHKDLPLIHVVLDDGQYASTGGQPTQAHVADFCGWARGAGIESVVSAADRAALTRAIPAPGEEPRAPRFVHCRVDSDEEKPPGRVSQPLPDHARRFAAAVAVTV